MEIVLERKKELKEEYKNLKPDIGIIAIFCITILISSYLIVRELQDNKNQRQTYKDLKQIIKPIEEDFKKDISPLFSENPDFIAWINIQGTKLDYPVMHTPKQPEKYLRLDFHQKYSRHGVPFLDGRCTLESDNLIIYGHNMKDGTMFCLLYTSHLILPAKVL